MSEGAVAFPWGSERLWLLPERAVWLPQARTLLLADLHLGKAETFQAHGIPLPSDGDAGTLNTLLELAARWRPAQAQDDDRTKNRGRQQKQKDGRIGRGSIEYRTGEHRRSTVADSIHAEQYRVDPRIVFAREVPAHNIGQQISLGASRHADHESAGICRLGTGRQSEQDSIGGCRQNQRQRSDPVRWKPVDQHP